jgi:hypothetical protein
MKHVKEKEYKWRFNRVNSKGELRLATSQMKLLRMSLSF